VLATLALVASLALAACGDEADVASAEYAYNHPPPSSPPPWTYILTCYGGPSDSSAYLGTPACGGKKVDGKWWYSTGAYSFGCGSKLELKANGKCAVVKVVDNGPAAWVEAKAKAKCGGTGYIIDASPLVTKHLFNLSCAGWSDCKKIQVRKVSSSTPEGPCSTTPTECDWNNGTTYRKCKDCGWQFCLSNGTWSKDCDPKPSKFPCPSGETCGSDAKCTAPPPPPTPDAAVVPDAEPPPEPDSSSPVMEPDGGGWLAPDGGLGPPATPMANTPPRPTLEGGCSVTGRTGAGATVLWTLVLLGLARRYRRKPR
jgi:hypothetical protein